MERSDPWYMAGTEGTGEYVVVVRTRLGRVGYRLLGGGSYRIRVEPEAPISASLARLLTPSSGWKQPGSQGQDRYSLVVGEKLFPNALGLAIRALGPEDAGAVINPAAPEWIQRIVERVVREKTALLPNRSQVFFSYSHKDKRWLEMIQTMLKPAMRSDMLWDDTRIDPGQEWKEEIRKSLASAKVAVLLVSKNFLASDFIRKHELSPILNAQKEEGLTVLWVPVGFCMYQDADIYEYQAAHEPSRPLDSLKGASRDKALVAICEKIKAAAERP